MTKAWTLQQGDRSLINYANELSVIFRKLDHFRPPISSLGDREYILVDRVYKLLQGLRPEFEGIRGQLYNRENPLTFDEAVAQLLDEESRLLEMKGGETTAYIVTQPGNLATTQHGTNLPNTKKGQMRNKENLWCNYCKRKDHVKETRWKLQSRTPQAHIMMQSPQGDMLGVQQWTPGVQQWMQNCSNPLGVNPPSYGVQVMTHNLNSQPQMPP